MATINEIQKSIWEILIDINLKTIDKIENSFESNNVPPDWYWDMLHIKEKLKLAGMAIIQTDD